MQATKLRDIVTKCSSSEEERIVMQSVADFVFSETKKEMGRFNNLSIYLKGFVNWFYGKKRLNTLLLRIERQLSYIKEGRKQKYQSFITKMSQPELEELRFKVLQRLEQYEEYIREKRETKSIFKEQKRLKLIAKQHEHNKEI